MKAIKIVNQEQLEQKAIDSMIAYEHGNACLDSPAGLSLAIAF